MVSEIRGPGRRTALSSAMMLSVASFARPAFAQQPGSVLDAVRKRGTLVAGVKTDYPPFGYVDGNGNVAGFDIEIAKYIAKALNVGIELRPVTSANRIAMLSSGTIDLLAASLTITRQRWEAIEFSVPYVIMGGKFLVRKGSGVGGYKDLAGKVVAYTQGSPSIALLQTAQPGAKPLIFQDKPQAIQAVMQDKAAAYADDAAPLLWFAKDHPDFDVVGESFSASPIGIGFVQNDTKWRNAINFTISDMWQDGTYATLYRQFFGADPDPCFKIYSWKL